MAKSTPPKPASAKSSKFTATAAQIHDQKVARVREPSVKLGKASVPPA